MSYHNGSVWPHDNAIMTYGLSRYGRREAALKMLASRFDASLFVDLHRMPELFCGFPRRPGEGPTLYPVACAPQSWAAASVFMLLQACLGLPIRGSPAQIGFSYPVLATFLQKVRIRHLCVGQGSVDLLLRPHADDITISIDHRAGDVEVFNVK